MATQLPSPPPAPAGKAAAKKKEEKKDEMSEEDLQKKADIDMLVERIKEPNPVLAAEAINTLKTEVRTATSTMTSVPKPLKFLRPHYDELKRFWESVPDGPENVKPHLADLLSVLAMTFGSDESTESLSFKLAGTGSELKEWGHEYVRNLIGELGREYHRRVAAAEEKSEQPAVADLMDLVTQIIPFNMRHNAEFDACDLLSEIGHLSMLPQYCDDVNYARVCQYLNSVGLYVSEGEDVEVFRISHQIYMQFRQFPDAMRVALKLNDLSIIRQTFRDCPDPTTKKQLAYQLARQRIFLDNIDDDDLTSVMYNSKLSDSYLNAAHELDAMEPKTPDDIFKTQLSDARTASSVRSARQSLAEAFVNGFVNAGFGKDKLLTEPGSRFLFDNKEHGMISAAASLGLVLLWDVDGGLQQIDKYLYAAENFIKAGGYMAIGICNAGVKYGYIDPSLALLKEHVESSVPILCIGAVLGLAYAYAGTCHQEVIDLLIPLVCDTTVGLEQCCFAGLALGLVCVGPSLVGEARQEVVERMVQALEGRCTATTDLNGDNSLLRFLCLGLGLLFLAKQDGADATLQALLTVLPDSPLKSYAVLSVESCAYAGSGNVIQIQKMLHLCGEHLETDNSHQAVAVLGIALSAMGEPLGVEMAARSFDHLLQYAEPNIRRAVPIALGLLSVCNPTVSITDTLSKISHDNDAETAQSAIFALGLVGAGTNNARIANMLRQLANYYSKEPNHLFVVRLAQGLLHMGKGLITIAPYHSDRFVMSHVSIASILTVLHACLDMKTTILGKYHYLLYALCGAMSPRTLCTVSPDLTPVKVPMRVGDAVDTAGQLGRPKTLTGAQTHTTPVSLSYTDRAELSNEEHIPVFSILEGTVILLPNPNFEK
eukprot:gnl/Spiro4/8705_TR4554_c0_g1_i1.p1 gnl/Spiro4/8705_TR4554_c0_g1~~gnl/Spiro4/8705_TR4554_c0_g1_i1.p1  ORF type:complete len:891 (+),score=267.11 gnl/Spiro4/8705_TR4554_c0_g1_i1:27-2675(+)